MSTVPSTHENDPNLSGLGRALLESKDGGKPASGPWVPLTAAELGELLPDYDIEKLLGRGGMGAVYKGTQKSLDRPVAIKILSATLDEGDQGFADRFKNEARALGKLKHPGIVGVYDFGTAADGLLYIVMEFIDGTDVARMIAKSGRLHTDHAMAITAHVCDALAYAHERGIIHRDIKPANIMVGYDGEVKVADFGLAKMTQSKDSGLTQSGMAMGTLHYMAPEALMLGSAVDHRADIYAMGVMLYQMLTGKLPQGMFELPSLQIKGLDPRYDGIIAKALREDREVRYQTILEMRTDLDAILTQPVVKVDAEASKPPAALNTQARPQRPGSPHAPPPEPRDGERAEKRTSPLLWAALITILVLGGWEFLRKRATARQPKGLVEATPSVAAKTPASPPTSPAPATPAVSTVPPPSTVAPANVTKEKPFVNSLGMKFVPVPDTEVLFCVHETRYRDYAAYATDSQSLDGTWKNQTFNEFTPGDRPEEHPVGNVSWEDAKAFCVWLSKKEARRYRLPTDQEWSVAVGLGDKEKWSANDTPESVIKDLVEFPWGKDWPPPLRAGNYNDKSRVMKVPGADAKHLDGYEDSFPTTAPVMSFAPNAFGLCDMSGNMWEWSQDWLNTQQKHNVVRGGSWTTFQPNGLLSSRRYRIAPNFRNHDLGFRCVIEAADASKAKVTAKSAASDQVVLTTVIQPPQTLTSGDPAKATKDTPFFNTLGMKFVPVPGTKVLFCIHETRYQDYAAYAAVAPDVDAFYQHQGADRFSDIDRPNEHPVIHVSWEDVQKFLAWLSQKEGKTYRLPTDREWSIAAGIGPGETWAADTTPATVTKNLTAFPWGNQWPPPPGSGNYSDASRKARAPRDDAKHLDGYDDGFPTTAPVMSYPPNPFGLHDMGGNVWEYCADWYNHLKIHRVWRGGAWDSYERDHLLSSHRWHNLSTLRNSHIGFRCVLEIDSQPASGNLATPGPETSGNVTTSVTAGADGWTSLFNGQDLTGWRIIGHTSGFVVDQGSIKTGGGARADLIYTGSGAAPAVFRDFELRMKVKTGDKGNSGLWFHLPPGIQSTKQCDQSLQVQIDNSFNEQRTGSIVHVRPLDRSPVADGAWFELRVLVQNGTVTAFVDGRQVNQWTQPQNWQPPAKAALARMGTGAIGLESWRGNVWIQDIQLRDLTTPAPPAP